MNIIQAKFRLGHLFWTRSVNESIAKDIRFAKFVKESLGRHVLGDWGEMSEEDYNGPKNLDH